MNPGYSKEGKVSMPNQYRTLILLGYFLIRVPKVHHYFSIFLWIRLGYFAYYLDTFRTQPKSKMQRTYFITLYTDRVLLWVQFVFLWRAVLVLSILTVVPFLSIRRRFRSFHPDNGSGSLHLGCFDGGISLSAVSIRQ